MIEQSTEQRDGAIILTLKGEFTIEEAPEIHHTLIEQVEHNPSHLVVDLSAVEFIDSSGVGTLVDAYRRLQKNKKNNNGKLCLVGANDMVRGVFEVSRLDRLFPICKSVDEALKA